ncbi:MAG TPA: phosphotransferase [Kofleriaceae bacterium]|nr:phosphotransferase [Kofleriaceae bacterium]
MNLEECLPPELLPAAFTRIAIGESGAGVYRVESAGTTYVLKIAPDRQTTDIWRANVEIQRVAATAGVAPQIIHVDELRRAVLSEHIVDRGFPMRLMTPTTRVAAITEMAGTLRRLHDAPVPANALAIRPREALREVRGRLDGFPLPAFATAVIERVLTETPPTPGPAVLSHNDVNPSNIAFDGERLVLLDWDAAGANDAYYDLATVALFFRFDDATCLSLISSHDGESVTALPARFVYLRRLVAAFCGTMMTHLARQAGHAGATDESLESAPALADIHARMRDGTLKLSTSEGRWQFGLALLKTATML